MRDHLSERQSTRESPPGWPSTSAIRSVLASLGAVPRLALQDRAGAESLADRFRRLDRFADLGGRVVQLCGDRRPVGDWLRRRRGTEFLLLDRVEPTERLGSRVEAVLRELGRDRLDVLLLDGDAPAVPVVELVTALREQLSAGRIGGFGVRNWAPARLEAFLALSLLAGVVPVAGYQFSLAVPERPPRPGMVTADHRVLPLLHRFQVPLIALSAQADGWFTDQSVPRRHPDAFDSPRNHEARRRCQRLAASYRSNAPAVALAWSLHQSVQTWPLVRAADPAEVATALAADRLALTPAELAFLGGN